MTAVIDTTVIAKSFSNAAHTYDAWALPQTIVAKKLCTFLPDDATEILDIGCGTGLMTDLVRKRYRTAHITGVDPAEGMIEQCTRRFSNDEKTTFIIGTAEDYSSPSSFDLAVATCSMHWFNDKLKALRNIRSSLTPEGCLAVAIPIDGSIPELCESYRAATGTEMPGLKLLTAAEYTSLFLQAGFLLEHILVEEVRLRVPDALFVVNSLRRIGGAPKGLSDDSSIPQKQLETLLRFYNEHFSFDDGVDLTYQFFFAVTTAISRS